MKPVNYTQYKEYHNEYLEEWKFLKQSVQSTKGTGYTKFVKRFLPDFNEKQIYNTYHGQQKVWPILLMLGRYFQVDIRVPESLQNDPLIKSILQKDFSPIKQLL